MDSHPKTKGNDRDELNEKMASDTRKNVGTETRQRVWPHSPCAPMRRRWLRKRRTMDDMAWALTRGLCELDELRGDMERGCPHPL